MSSVPVSQYEALRAEMRSLVQQAQQVQEIATQVISSTSSNSSASSTSTNHQIQNDVSETCLLKNATLNYEMESLVLESARLSSVSTNIQYEARMMQDGDPLTSEEECGAGRVPGANQMSVSSEPVPNHHHHRPPVASLYHGTWPVEKTTMWNSEPTKLSPENPRSNMKHNMDQASVLSFASSSGGVPLDRVLGSPDRLTRRSMQQLEAKVDMVYSLLAMLGGQEHADMGDTLLALSTSPESCLAMRQSGCIPLLVQLVQSDKDLDTRKKASEALHNLVYAQPDEKLRKRETRVLKLLEQARAYTDALKNNTEFEPDISSSTETQENGDNDRHPVPIIANLMKHSFDEGHRQAICQLGGIHIIASLVETEHTLHGSTMDTPSCILLRRYACMALTNLTFGDSGNKALLCSFREFMRALVVQLQSPSDELRQVTASVLRNLSWRADQTSKEILREVGTVAGLMKAGMATTKENTLKSILSALWNLSAHCTENKLEICAVENGLGFLVDMLSYKAPSKSLTINENAGGILRNISSQIAVRDDYREILRKHNCLQILLEQLKSPSLTIVSNACGTLWNLSAKNQADQEALWQMGAPAMLRSLNHSKHKMIATGSSAALKNLLNSRPSHSLLPSMDSTARAMDLPALPTLGARKQKALLRDLDQDLTETYENLERESPTKNKSPDEDKLLFKMKNNSVEEKYLLQRKVASRSESREFEKGGGDAEDLCNGFSSLNIAGEPSTSYHQKELRNGSGTPNGRLYSGASSLVYVSSTRKNTFIPVRNNYSDAYPDDIDIDTSEEPIDYSRKYSETRKAKDKERDKPSYQYKNPTTSTPANNKIKPPPTTTYGIYAETDLDQPTDYSLRYAEDDSDSDNCAKITKDNNEYLQDTVKTYCTEGTPLNFSTATSMSDLRIDIDKSDIDNDKGKEKKNKIPTLSHLDEKDHCSVEDISDLDNRSGQPNALSSGLMSPEKPVNYCEEGTPGYFSRVSSFGSLNSIPVDNKSREEAPSTPPRAKETPINDVKTDSSPSEAKVVKFVEPSSGSNCAEQTPLMFSRSSSLGSLDSVEQHSIHDDRSSVVSDFSRLTSGIVSPSELPDSPTQTVPPSPRPRKGNLEFPSTSRNAGAGFAARGPPQPAPRSLQKPSVFEDNVTKFKEESTPVQFSTATSISSLTIDDQDEPVVGDLKTPKTKEDESEKRDTEQEKRDSSSEFNEALSENDEDDDILADCINIGMQNNRHRLSKSSSPPVSKIPSASSYKPRTSGIPLPRSARVMPKTPPRAQHSDTLRTYCTEDTPALLSHAGSNSDLSVLSIQTDSKSKTKDYLSDDSSSNMSGDNDNILAECIQSGMPKAKARSGLSNSTPLRPFARNERKDRFLGAKDEVSTFAVENSPCQFSLRSSLSDLTVDGSIAGLARTLGEGETSPNNASATKANENRLNLSRQESLSSLSVESFGSIETEQALLEQCISSGMPKSKEKPIGVATKHFNPARKSSSSSSSECHSKNANGASAVGNTKTTATSPAGIPPTAADVGTENGVKKGLGLGNARTAWSGETRNGCDASDKAADSTVEERNHVNNLNDEKDDKINNRMLDPDAMIESLDRFTAELVSQASLHLAQKEESKFITSVTDSADTWNEDFSPNELTLPSFSGSVPNVITFESDGDRNEQDLLMDDEKLVDEIDGMKEDYKSNDFSSLNTSTMTESTLIAMEATRMATTFQQHEVNDDFYCHSINSLASLELDQVQPPSQMNSLTSSLSPKVRRKRSLPANLIVRRALSNSLNQGSSLESLDNHSLSNLDQVNPPSAMAEVLDMDGSMVSVASLNSEGEDDKPNHIFSSKQPNSVLELENVNPPSLLNEITDLCNSLADVNTETEMFEDCTMGNEVTITEFSDANSTTPIQTDFDMSSAESTPTKRLRNLNRRLTPKQRRHLAKERYKTYTVAAELVMRMGEEDDSVTEDYRTVGCDEEGEENTESYATAAEHREFSTATFTRSPKRTPKERRQMEQDRFQTQVLDKASIEGLETTPPVSATPTSNESSPEPTRSKLSIRRNFAQKRLENRDRFKTQTITEASLSPPPELLQREADKIVRTIGETKTTRVDELIECETLSLVSNEDDSEHNSGSSINYRTYHKSWGLGGENNALPVVGSNTRISSDLENYNPDGELDSNSNSDAEEEVKKVVKIVKPSAEAEVVNEVKGIRGKRKPLYSKASLNNKMVKPMKTVTSNLVRNVTSTLKSSKQVVAKPPVIPQPAKRHVGNKPGSASSSPKGSPVRNISNVNNNNKVSPRNNNKLTPRNQNQNQKSPKQSPKHEPKPPQSPPVLERQGTFTKDETGKGNKSKIPSGIPKAASTSRIAKPMGRQQNVGNARPGGIMKSASADRAHKPTGIHVYNRSPSADGREKDRAMKTSPSSQSLKNNSGTVKKIPEPKFTRQLSNSNLQQQKPGSNLLQQRSSPNLQPQQRFNSGLQKPKSAQQIQKGVQQIQKAIPVVQNGTPAQKSGQSSNNTGSKLITSRIANLWKKVEESKKQPQKKDNRVWIQNERPDEPDAGPPKLTRSGTFENKESLLRAEPRMIEVHNNAEDEEESF